ncbi:8365_t:CDS:2 [Paraglomus brasilianum]|uniref:8365_t:CDS:1 n=1 Tax=Paraglomus brasilianum TaxID=144538 RepID=A0A9N9GAF8_9GLOM|nr:8365_t:CDS:2 [Paraglomus brasilianum]
MITPLKPYGADDIATFRTVRTFANDTTVGTDNTAQRPQKQWVIGNEISEKKVASGVGHEIPDQLQEKGVEWAVAMKSKTSSRKREWSGWRLQEKIENCWSG